MDLAEIRWKQQKIYESYSKFICPKCGSDAYNNRGFLCELEWCTNLNCDYEYSTGNVT